MSAKVKSVAPAKAKTAVPVPAKKNSVPVPVPVEKNSVPVPAKKNSAPVPVPVVAKKNSVPVPVPAKNSSVPAKQATGKRSAPEKEQEEDDDEEEEEEDGGDDGVNGDDDDDEDDEDFEGVVEVKKELKRKRKEQEPAQKKAKRQVVSLQKAGSFKVGDTIEWVIEAERSEKSVGWFVTKKEKGADLKGTLPLELTPFKIGEDPRKAYKKGDKVKAKVWKLTAGKEGKPFFILSLTEKTFSRDDKDLVGKKFLGLVHDNSGNVLLSGFNGNAWTVDKNIPHGQVVKFKVESAGRKIVVVRDQ